MVKQVAYGAALALVLGAAALTAVPAAQAATQAEVQTATKAFQNVLKNHWAWTLKENPVLATSLGVRTYDRTLGELSIASLDRHRDAAKGFVSQLEAIKPGDLRASDRLNRAILLRSLKDDVAGQAFGERLILFTNRNGWHIDFASLPDQVPLFTKADYESYVARLNDYPRYNDEGIATTRAALKGGFVQSCESMDGFDKSIQAHIVNSPSKSVFMRPFERKPDTITEADWAHLKTQAEQAITTKVVPAYQAFLAFYKQEYAPKCRQVAGVSALPQGAEYYAYRARTQTTTNLTPDQIHNLGLSEVARIRAEMDDVVKRANFKGDRKDFVKFLRSDRQFYARSAEDLMEQTAALAKRIDGEMPKLFGTLPRLPYTVKPIPAATAEGNTTAYYEPGQMEAGRPGVYRVNTTKLDQRPLFEMPALTLHEAVPGHHHQLALQQELDLPNFRRYATFFTAFVEGWGLYSESLGQDMRLYETPYEDFGRLSYEMWRACRLVVDTGIHSKGWTRQQAIDFMVDNTALSRANIEAEVDRYISWPGQALAYKIGQLKIKELRTRAQKELGSRFDIRVFHDRVLENGAVPLDVLEDQINGWIASQKARRS